MRKILLITVADLIKYLQQFPPDTPTNLDKDGWDTEDEHDQACDFLEDNPGQPIPPERLVSPEEVQELIHDRGLFWYYEMSKLLLVNN